MGDHVSSLFDQDGQQFVLQRREEDVLSIHFDKSLFQVHGEWVILVRYFLRYSTLRPMQGGLDAGEEFLIAERLDHIVVGAQFEAANHIPFGPERGREDDGSGGDLLQLFADDPAVHVGQKNVKQDQVRVRVTGRL